VLRRLLEPCAALLLSPLVLFGGQVGTIVYLLLVLALVLRGAAREVQGPLARLSARGKGEDTE
jgi:hypothetical protein